MQGVRTIFSFPPTETGGPQGRDLGLRDLLRRWEGQLDLIPSVVR